MKWIFSKYRAAVPLIAAVTALFPCSLRAADLTVFAAASLEEVLDDEIHR
jgi:ABC-type molybdate transport system substrate-binding protein